jgi:predicted phosphodiesterase
MKLQLLSDLHLESQPDFVARPAPDADFLVLAGDIGSYQNGSKLQDADFGLAQFSPLLGWPVPVYFVPGNHEYDSLDFDAGHARLRETCARLGITWLDRQVLTLPKHSKDGQALRLMGTTLWTDFDALAATPRPWPGKEVHAASAGNRDIPLATQALEALEALAAWENHPDNRKAREKAFRAADYHLKKTGTLRHGLPFLSEAVRAEGLQCQAWLSDALSQPFDGKTIVVTHFAPSLRSADPRYGRVPGTAGFCNALDDLLAQAALWLHGHLHLAHDYVHRGCRVVANPLGYAHKKEQLHFHAQAVIEI